MTTSCRERIVFLTIFLFLLAAEVCIGRFAHDDFIRPYLGDVLVVIVLYALIRAFVPDRFPWLAAAILAFAFAVEFSQIPPLVDLLGIRNRLLRILMGTSYSPKDLLAYAVGTIPGAAYDLFLFSKQKQGRE